MSSLPISTSSSTSRISDPFTDQMLDAAREQAAREQAADDLAADTAGGADHCGAHSRLCDLGQQPERGSGARTVGEVGAEVTGQGLGVVLPDRFVEPGGRVLACTLASPGGP